MKALRTKVCAYAVALLTSLGFTTTSSLAGSSDFAGIFAAVHASINGAEIDGAYTEAASTTATATGDHSEGSIGKLIPVAGYELGFNLPLGDLFFVGVGATRIKGSAEMAEGDDYSDEADFSIDVSNYKMYWIQPSISIWDNSAIYFKFGRNMANLDATGDVTGTINNLQGDYIGFGTATIANNGLYVKTELGATEFNDIRIRGVGGGGGLMEGTPYMAHGSMTIGYKF